MSLEHEQAILQRARRQRDCRDIDIDIENQRVLIDHLLKLARQFHDLDMRPMIYDGTMLQRVGPDPVPYDLSALIASERQRFYDLQLEYVEAREREEAEDRERDRFDAQFPEF
jgi:hypothetical protein